MTDTCPILLMTRPLAASVEFLDALGASGESGFRPVTSPLIGLRTCGRLPEMTRYFGVIFTSANAVHAYRVLGGAEGGTGSDVCFVVGSATATAARQAGFDPQSADGDATDLIRLIARLRPRGPLLHLRGAHARGNIAKTLSLDGIETHEAVIYDQPLLDLSTEARAALNGSVPIVVPLFSPRSAARLAEYGPARAPLLIAAMSKAVQKEVVDLSATHNIVAETPSATAMQKTVLHLLNLARTLESRQGGQ